MPIYEYVCSCCGQAFTHLARTLKDRAKVCPQCGATKPVKQLSTFAAPSTSPAGAGCDTCEATSFCPAAGRGGCGGCHGSG